MTEPLPPPPLPEGSEINEQEYIEMSNHFKKLYDNLSDKNFEKDIKIMEIKKELITVYGFIRVIDNILERIYEVPHEIIVLVECLRGHLSDIIDKEIFKIKDIDIHV
jgi:hypothetical protein